MKLRTKVLRRIGLELILKLKFKFNVLIKKQVFFIFILYNIFSVSKMEISKVKLLLLALYFGSSYSQQTFYVTIQV